MFAGFVHTAMQPFVKLLSLLVVFSVHGSYYTALSYDVIYNILVSFTFCLANVEVICLCPTKDYFMFCTLIMSQAKLWSPTKV